MTLFNISFISSSGFSLLLCMLETFNKCLKKNFFPSFQEWQCVQSKGCFFLEEDGEIISHQYRMQIAQRSMVYLTIKPLNLSQVEGKFKFFILKFQFMPSENAYVNVW